MKICAYCDSFVKDDADFCPHCSSAKFLIQCPRCGRAHEGLECPHCRQAEEEARAAAEATRQAQAAAYEESVAREKANSHLVAKTVLTVFFPFIGGYFLIKRGVNAANRIFAIIWCFFFAFVVSTNEGTVSGRIFTILIALAPVAVYAIREKAWEWNRANTAVKVTSIALAVVFLLTSAAACAKGDTEPSSESSTSSSSSAQTTSSSSSQSASASASGSQSAGASASSAQAASKSGSQTSNGSDPQASGESGSQAGNASSSSA